MRYKAEHNMTLVVTEIVYHPEKKDASYILCAADRRLSDEFGVADTD
jgi:hypothetical protein